MQKSGLLAMLQLSHICWRLCGMFVQGSAMQPCWHPDILPVNKGATAACAWCPWAKSTTSTPHVVCCSR